MPETEHDLVIDAQYHDEADRHDAAAQGEARADGDLVGSGAGGSPNPYDSAEPSDRDEANSDPEVAELTQNLRQDAEPYRVSPADASEEAGTGTDR